MYRYFRLYLCFFRFSLSKAMQFRLDFFFRIGMDIIFYIVNILFYDVIYTHTNLIGGWDRSQMMVFVSGFLLIDAIYMTFLSDNIPQISQMVNRGDLDYYLIRPVSSLFFLSLQNVAINSSINLLMAAGLLAYSLSSCSSPVTSSSVFLFLVLIINGTYLRFLVRMFTVIPIFWLHSNRGLEMMFYHLVRFLERPDAIFSGAVHVILTTILPFSLMVSFPARLLLEEFNVRILVHIFIVTMVLSLLVRIWWKQGLKAYSSASS